MRSRSTAVQLTIAVILAVTPKLYAPIGGTSGTSGADRAVRRDNHRAGLREVVDPDFGGSADYKIWRERTLKGSIDEERLTVRMRQLDITTAALESHGGVWLGEATPLSFELDARYVLFSSKTDRDAKVPYENVNCEGSSFQVSRWLRLETLDGKSLDDALKFLLVDYRDLARRRLQHIEQRTQTYLDGHETPNQAMQLRLAS
jgi:hypothetical protein